MDRKEFETVIAKLFYTDPPFKDATQCNFQIVVSNLSKESMKYIYFVRFCKSPLVKSFLIDQHEKTIW